MRDYQLNEGEIGDLVRCVCGMITSENVRYSANEGQIDELRYKWMINSCIIPCSA